MFARLVCKIPAIAILWLIVILIYAQTLGFSYVWDDIALFVDNISLRTENIEWLPLMRPVLPDAPYFRPLVLLTWMLEYQFFRLNPIYSHLINVFFHLGITTLVALLGKFVFGENRISINSRSFYAALAYSLHPCLIESVAWISGRFDLMATFFLMFSCFIALKKSEKMFWWKKIFWYFIFTLSTILGMFSKETGVLFPGFLLIFIAAMSSKNRPCFYAKLLNETRARIGFLLCFLFALVLFGVFRNHALGFSTYTDFSAAQIFDGLKNYGLLLRTLSFYTFMTVFPFGHISPRHDLIYELATYRQNISFIFFSLLILLTIIFMSFKKNRPAILMIGFYIGIFPVIGIFKVMNGETIGSERFLSSSLIFFSLAMVDLSWNIGVNLCKKFNILPALKFLMIGLISILVFNSFTITSMWRSDLKLWAWQYDKFDNNTIVRSIYLYSLASQKSEIAQKKFESEIEKIRRKYNGLLPYDVQIVYAKNLLLKNDPEALFYFEGLMENLPSIWEKHYGISEAPGMYDATYFSVIIDYAQSLIIFRGNYESAINILLDKRNHSNEGVWHQIDFQIIAAKYLLGDVDGARKYFMKTRNEFEKISIQNFTNTMKSVVFYSCKNVQKENENCVAYADKFETDVLESRE